MDNINVEIVFALPNRCLFLHVTLAKGTNIKSAIIQSGIMALYDGIDLNKNKVGIYGKLSKLSDILSDGDRVEIYRPLRTNPTKIRNQRVNFLK